MGIYESELACGCTVESMTYETPSKSYIKSFCDKHAPVVSNVIKYNLRDLFRRYTLLPPKDAFCEIRILEESPVRKRGRAKVVRFEILDPLFDISSFRNPVFFSEFEGAPAFQRRPDGIVECIDLFDTSLVFIHGL